ncbi:lysozyme [Scopulibacillus darangshiensis]|uniref:Lysozyme n=1 Tax=Scopulibacillus darangshiensis TaxID=442528 RepID=A0A4R2NYJ7_9BACL|nr:GH25 family lysozyme [Scopulibacillus darangshiensis]TCP26601.1 lysozyme [Scopulibacillus darangshiensis]
MQARTKHHIKGIDVSHWQGEISWEQVRKDGVAYVFIKATEGKTFVDPMLAKHSNGAEEAGLLLGYYHFARFSNKREAVAEARHFTKAINGLKAHLPLVLDLETGNGVAKEDLSKAALTFLDTVKSEAKHDVMLYTFTNFARRHLTSLLKYVPLWIAHYGVTQPKNNGIWNKWSVFQYTSEGQINGIKGHVDINLMEPSLMERCSKAETITGATDNQIPETPFYKMKQGETFWDLERKWHLPHGTLETLNPDMNPKLLKVGQKVKRPASIEGTKSRNYIIKSGDTFWELEKRHGWEHGTLKQLNPDLDTRKLQIGARILIP